jgi:type I restriction enzyme S subunit
MIYDLPIERSARPADWIIQTLEQLAHVVGGGTPDTSIPEYWNPPEIPWVTPSDITACVEPVLMATERGISKAGLSQSSATLLPNGSILLTSRATIGECRLAGIPVATNQGFTSLVPKVGTDSRFLFYLTQTLKPTLVRLAAGTTFIEVSRREVRRVNVCVPSEQAERVLLGQIVTAADEALATARDKLKASKSLKMALMQQLFTRGIPGRHSEFKPTKFGEVPKGWDTPQLRRLLRSSTNGHYVPESAYGSGTPIVRIDTFEDGEFYTRIFQRVRIPDSEIALFEVLNGDVLLNRVNSIPFLGKVVYVEGLTERTIFESNMMRLRFDDPTVARFVALALCAPINKRRIWSMGRPAVAQLSINQREVGQFVIGLPHKEERDEIVAIVSAANQNIFACAAAIQAIERVKQSLLQNLLTGRVRVQVS